MRHKQLVIRVGLVILLLAVSACAAFAEARGLGLRPPTPEERARFEMVRVRVDKVSPNALALERYRAEIEAGRTTVSTLYGLPAVVDNSILTSFPPIRSQGMQGSCSAWATSYYYNTYLQAQDGGYDVSGGDNSLICSPGFMYNLINYGMDGGSSIMYAMLKLSQVGCCSWEDKPYSDTDYTSWPSEAAWVGALRNRTSTPHTLDVAAPGGLEALKQHLANGNLAVFGMDVYETWYNNYPNNDVGINNGVYYAEDGDAVGGHAMTIVGYDDTKSYVDHRDGLTHYGAFLIANSWGTWWGVRNTTGAGTYGFGWIAYTAFTDGTLGPGGSEVYFNDDRADYRPSIYAVVGVNHATREDLSLSCSIGSPAVWQSHYAIWYDGGAYPVSDADCIAVDMTDGAGFLASPPTLVAARLAVSSGAGTSGTITRADFYEDLDGNGSYAAHPSPDPTVTVLAGSVGYATLSLTPSSGQDCDITGSSVPSATEWESVEPSTVTVANLGASAWLVGTGYQLLSQDSVDRWGVLSVPLEADVPSGTLYDFAFDLTAPPVTTLAYPAPVSDTAPGVLDTLPLDLTVALNTTPLNDGAFSQEIAISRFSDIQPGTAGAWARFYVEECAGRVPMIVGGYEDGTYRPTLGVSRDAMAVFMARSLKLELPAYQGLFSDVPSSHWAAGYIEALVGAGVVAGYPDGTYRPAGAVNRDAMAVFVARGLAGGDTSVPEGPTTATFSDVPTSYWAFKHIEYAVDQGVVGGYPDGTYRPVNPVDRAQMSVFVYRAFLQPAAAAVVLAGPAVTATDPASGGQCGWASLARGDVSDPGSAYVAFDAVRLGADLAAGGTWDIKFELRSAASPGTPATGSYTTTVSLNPTQITALRDAAKASGDPYYACAWDLPSGLAAGDYLLVISVEDDTGTMRELARKPAFTLTP